MAIRTLSYKDLSPEQRREGAKKARERIQGALLNPSLTTDQLAYLKTQMARVDQWERCELNCGHDHDHDDPPPTQ